MPTPKKRTILDYFSQNTEESEGNHPKGRRIVESDDNVLCELPSGLSENNKENEDIGNCLECKSQTNDSEYTNFRQVQEAISFKKPELSKIVADYLDTCPSDFASVSEQLDPLSSDILAPSSSVLTREERYEFLVNVKDKNGVRMGESGYDPTTLHIPQKYWDKFTPFEKQFWEIKKENFDTVIFFKKGKFYELYENDAEIATKLFDLRITERVNMKMAGVPESSYESWAAKFIAHGFKIGRVDQAENAIGKKIREQNGKKDKIIARELKEIVTTGTAYNSEFFGTCFEFYVAILIQHTQCSSETCTGPLHFSALLYDASSNKILSKTFCDSYDGKTLRTVFVQNDIREIITDESLQFKKGIPIHKPIKTPLASPRKYEFQNDNEYQCFVYLHNFMKSLCREQVLARATISEIKDSKDHFSLDGATLVNLDILENNFDHSEDKTLFRAINYCSSPFGQRLMRNWIVTPLKSLERIAERRRIVRAFERSDILEIVGLFKSAGDIERYSGKLANANPTHKDLCVFLKSLNVAEKILSLLQKIFENQLESMKEIASQYHNTIQHAITEFTRIYTITDDEIVPRSEDDELFQLTRQLSVIQNQLEMFLEDLKKKSGFTDLSYKSVGKEIFQVETSAANKMPSEFYAVSSTKTHRRYYSAELKKIIASFEECEERIFQSRGSVLRRAIEFIRGFSFNINQVICYLATIDCLMSFSIFNRSLPTTEPIFSDNLELIEFTNPVYPDYISNTFTPKNNVTLVTGPNMGGKSTFLRSICLNIILAQMGMNVVCKSMMLPIFDQIFTRIGASDSLARGESTFMVEMSETSKILNYCTKQSFVIMDELGRGTSTKDGEAIARAVINYLKEIGCMCLFSTHYHQLVQDCQGVDKSFVSCKMNSEDIVFLYKIEEGVCNDSHGIYVAKLAGIPQEIIEKALKIKRVLSEK